MLLPGISVWLITVAFFKFPQKIAAKFWVQVSRDADGQQSS
jgi:hypothetical protein